MYVCLVLVLPSARASFLFSAEISEHPLSLDMPLHTATHRKNAARMGSLQLLLEPKEVLVPPSHDKLMRVEVAPSRLRTHPPQSTASQK